MNTTLLKSKMVLYRDTNTTLGKALGVSYQTVSAKLNKYKRSWIYTRWNF